MGSGSKIVFSLGSSVKHPPTVLGHKYERRGTSCRVPNPRQVQPVESEAGPSIHEGIRQIPLHFGPPTFKNRWRGLQTRQVGLRTYKITCGIPDTFPTDDPNEISILQV